MKKSVYKIDNGLTRKRENLLKHLVIYVIDMIAAVRISIMRAGITRFVIHCPPSELPKDVQIPWQFRRDLYLEYILYTNNKICT